MLAQSSEVDGLSQWPRQGRMREAGLDLKIGLGSGATRRGSSRCRISLRSRAWGLASSHLFAGTWKVRRA